jgi:hypothetical protein
MGTPLINRLAIAKELTIWYFISFPPAVDSERTGCEASLVGLAQSAGVCCTIALCWSFQIFLVVSSQWEMCTVVLEYHSTAVL